MAIELKPNSSIPGNAEQPKISPELLEKLAGMDQAHLKRIVETSGGKETPKSAVELKDAGGSVVKSSVTSEQMLKATEAGVDKNFMEASAAADPQRHLEDLLNGDGMHGIEPVDMLNMATGMTPEKKN